MSQPSRCDWYEQMLDVGRSASVGRQVFFVVGCQKSGTTWMQALLNAHGQIACRGEGHLTDSLFLSLKQAIDHHCKVQTEHGRAEGEHLLPGVDDLLAVTRLLGDQLLARYLAQEDDHASITAVGDKTPEYACGMPILAKLYPGAKFIHVIRDGRDAAVSGWAHLERTGAQHSFATFADYAAYFAQHHWTQYITHAQHVGRQIDDRYLELRYEAMRSDPDAHAKQMFALLGVADDDATVRGCVEQASFEKLSGGRAEGEEDRSSHFRKGIAGDWVNHFDDHAIARFESHAGDLLDELGYARALTATV